MAVCCIHAMVTGQPTASSEVGENQYLTVIRGPGGKGSAS